jgi:hypothetical protein
LVRLAGRSSSSQAVLHEALQTTTKQPDGTWDIRAGSMPFPSVEHPFRFSTPLSHKPAASRLHAKKILAVFLLAVVVELTAAQSAGYFQNLPIGTNTQNQTKAYNCLILFYRSVRSMGKPQSRNGLEYVLYPLGLSRILCLSDELDLRPAKSWLHCGLNFREAHSGHI